MNAGGINLAEVKISWSLYFKNQKYCRWPRNKVLAESPPPPIGVLTQSSGHASVQIMLFLCAKFLLKVQLDLASIHPGQWLENCQFLRPELRVGRICFTADKDFNVKCPRPLRMEKETDLSEEQACWLSCWDALTSLCALEGAPCRDGPEQAGICCLFRPPSWERGLLIRRFIWSHQVVLTPAVPSISLYTKQHVLGLHTTCRKCHLHLGSIVYPYQVCGCALYRI